MAFSSNVASALAEATQSYGKEKAFLIDKPIKNAFFISTKVEITL
jgi:hypothetical protein